MVSSAGILPGPSLLGARCLTGRAPGTRGAQQVRQPEHLLLSEICRLALAPRGNLWLHDLGSLGPMPCLEQRRLGGSTPHVVRMWGQGLSKPQFPCFTAPGFAALYQLEPSPSAGGVDVLRWQAGPQERPLDRSAGRSSLEGHMLTTLPQGPEHKWPGPCSHFYLC